MRVDLKTAEKIANLARLTLSEEELKRYAAQMDQILEYIEQLQNLDTNNVKPLSHVQEMINVFRSDEVKPSLSHEAVFANAPQEKAGYFVVPKVIKDINP
ncbi:MAG TPA: Asp-tRNA(Asn)/Glu-tRNA(Gln) amidotransferase subunit GatC [Candidatus Marinimicrobia bacterium]|nr:Asp-tRNA(Asn)/Glu-tRNA(Gln) amidotransferase subunit GatC [Candidatus Neomarinimicrobiota bacterium]HRS51919.1 Asp-tRNA(Asn)/Glu-tRNA(Gln) amidotransferase subunit GatC [Candidatus Neomarinimicrobiota bacterium]HRU93456.1 Asp-tRNA(Asn)/Glu-tRNA(Gln) amidotransferase subunit GatC [Candidatus Neomarinimicrobiota bacterium]